MKKQMIATSLGGIGQGRARNRAANPSAIVLRALSIQACNLIAQAKQIK